MTDSQVIPGIVMVDAVPIFYRIPSTGLPECKDAVPNQDAYPEEEFVPLANRRIVMQCYEAFKASVVSMRSQTPGTGIVVDRCVNYNTVCYSGICTGCIYVFQAVNTPSPLTNLLNFDWRALCTQRLEHE